jgi:hypothetical protein
MVFFADTNETLVTGKIKHYSKLESFATQQQLFSFVKRARLSRPGVSTGRIFCHLRQLTLLLRCHLLERL